MCRLRCAIVGGAVDFYGQSMLGAEKVEHVRAEGVLATEQKTIQLPSTDVAPEQRLPEASSRGEVAVRDGRWIEVPA